MQGKCAVDAIVLTWSSVSALLNEVKQRHLGEMSCGFMWSHVTHSLTMF